jgi:hypothetical protein
VILFFFCLNFFISSSVWSNMDNSSVQNNGYVY